MQMAELRMAGDSLRQNVKKDPLFENASPEFTSDLLKLFSAEVLSPKERIFTAGDAADRMYFIGYGSVDILVPMESDNERVLQQLSAPRFFGFEDFYTQQLREYTARASERCKYSLDVN
jgi:CRP-like cAMP-binding protein